MVSGDESRNMSKQSRPSLDNLTNHESLKTQSVELDTESSILGLIASSCMCCVGDQNDVK